MIRGVYIGKSNTGDYSLVSTGDYINPISPVFRLRDSGTTLEKIQTLYIIVNDISIEFAKIKVVGSMTTVRTFLSWDKKKWSNEIVTSEPIDATGTRIIKPFYIRFTVDDVLMYYNLRQSTALTNYKLKLIYS